MLSTVHIVDDPSTAETDSGAFCRIILSKHPALNMPEIFSSAWSVQVLEKIGGIYMPHSQKMSGIHESLLLQFLSTWNGNHHSKKYIYLTLEAAKILLPKMCVPQVPFALAVADEELKALCVSSLSRSLQFEAI